MVEPHREVYNIVTMDLTITVLCEGNFGAGQTAHSVSLAILDSTVIEGLIVLE